MKQVEFQVSKAWLSLDGYFLNELNIKINPNFKAGELLMGTGLHIQHKGPIDSTNSEINIDVRAARHNDDPRKHMVEMKIDSTEPHAEKPLPYEFSIALSAYFTISNELQLSDEVQLATLRSATNTIYGICREILRSNTARGPFPGVLLPAVVFDATITESSTKAKKKAITARKKRS